MARCYTSLGSMSVDDAEKYSKDLYNTGLNQVIKCIKQKGIWHVELEPGAIVKRVSKGGLKSSESTFLIIVKDKGLISFGSFNKLTEAQAKVAACMKTDIFKLQEITKKGMPKELEETFGTVPAADDNKKKKREKNKLRKKRRKKKNQLKKLEMELDNGQSFEELLSDLKNERK